MVDIRLDLVDGIRRLPYQERRALMLRISHDLKQSEIASQLGCSQMQVSRLLKRATTKLRAPARMTPIARAHGASAAREESDAEAVPGAGGI